MGKLELQSNAKKCDEILSFKKIQIASMIFKSCAQNVEVESFQWSLITLQY